MKPEEKSIEQTQKVQLISKFLDSKYDFQENGILHGLDIKRKGESEYKSMSIFDGHHLHDLVQEECINCTENQLKFAVNGLTKKTGYPISEYFQTLPKWDGKTDYIGSLLDSIEYQDSEVMGPEILRSWIINLTLSGLTPSTINKFIPILIGPQGIGKAAFVQKLLPASLRNYFYIGDNAIGGKETLFECSKSLIFSLNYIDSLSTHQCKKLGLLAEKKKYQLTPPYYKNTLDLTRRCSIIGTANDFSSSWSKLPTSIPLIIKKITPLNFDIDLVYSQALALGKEGYPAADNLQAFADGNIDLIQFKN